MAPLLRETSYSPESPPAAMAIFFRITLIDFAFLLFRFTNVWPDKFIQLIFIFATIGQYRLIFQVTFGKCRMIIPKKLKLNTNRMSFFGFLFKKKFYLHLLLAMALTVVLFFITLQFIKIYSNHGDTYMLPDFSGKTLNEIADERYDELYEFVVIDSIFDTRNPKGTVAIQDPPSGSVVKKGRKVYVTLVAFSREKVEMPDLIDLSLRQAVNSLRAKGLRVNELQYVEDFAGNAVLEQLFDGEVIEEGSIIDKGSGIDLVVGLGNDNYAPVPFLIGLNLHDAEDAINKASFNLGTVYFLDGEDPEHSRVYRQQPAWSEKARLFKGRTINISLRSELDFDFEALIREMKPDTTRLADTTNAASREF